MERHRAGEAVDPMKYEIGQKVWILPYHRRARPDHAEWGLIEATVVKVGRLLVHVRVGDYGTIQRFDILTGKERVENFADMLTTPEIEAERAEAEALRRRLSSSAGMSMFGIAARLPLADLQEIEKMIERQRAREEER